MSDDTPISPEGTPDPDGGAAAAGEAKAWYQQPLTWGIAGLAALLVVIVIIVVANNNDDDESVSTATTTSAPGSTTSESATTTIGATTSAAPETTAAPTTTVAPETTAAPDAVTIEASPVSADVVRRLGVDADFPFQDGDVQAHWYTWDGFYVVVYGGWDATAGEPFCPGNSVNIGGAFDFISNSPTTEGSCDPEELYPNLVDDDSFGARVCDTLVIYRTIIPVDDDTGAPIAGQLYGTIERVIDGSFVSASAVADIVAVAELDPEADAYSVPEGWLPDGATEATC